MIRLLHLSDLHICGPNARNSIEELFRIVKQKKWLTKMGPLSFTFHDPLKLNALKGALSRLTPKPQVVCVSGDVTTFGDDESFDLAKAFIDDILHMLGGDAKLIIVPGNHDNFLHAWSELLNRYNDLPLFFRAPGHFILGDLLIALRKLVPTTSVSQLSGFSAFMRRVSATHDIVSVQSDFDFSLKIIPISSVSEDPLWMNAGAVSEEDWRVFKQKIPVHRSKKEARLVLMHHNPFSAPQVKEAPIALAYNATAHASSMLAEFQSRGVDLLLCGHQHSRTVYSIDFINGSSGRLWVSHAPAACADDNSESGFSVIDFQSRHTASVTGYVYNAGEYASAASSCDLFLEPDPVSDRLTLFAHSEIRSYYFRGGAEVDNRFKELSNALVDRAEYDFVVVGQTLRGFSRPKILRGRVLEKLRTCRDLKFHLLVMDPDVLHSEISKVTEQNVLFESLRTNFAEEGRASIGRLVDFRKDVRHELGQGAAARIRILKIPRLVSFGANLHGKLDGSRFNDGEMMIQILPLGNWREEAKARLYLRQRSDEALFSFYNQFILSLMDIATEI